jgi:hypothetical protein
MTKEGLQPFANPLLDMQQPNGVPSAVFNPFGFAPTPAPRQDEAAINQMGQLGVNMARQAGLPNTQINTTGVAYSKSLGKFYVQGITFDEDDAQSLVESKSWLQNPPVGLPTDGDWTPIDPQSYSQLVDSVQSPTLGKLAGKAFGRGVDSLQMLAGRGLQLAGAEQLGGNIVAQQAEDLRKSAPFERRFTNVETPRDAVEWFVANFAEQGPNIIEAVATGALGFLGGTAVGGPVAGAGAALAGLVGKTEFKNAVKAAAAKKLAGETLDAAETKLLREAAGITGAVAASYANNYATGAADIYGEMREQGVGADDVGARLTSLAGAIPYAALSSLPEYVLAGRLLGNAPARGAKSSLLKRGAIGLGAGGTLEGGTEAAQEALVMGLSGQDLNTPEAADRLINSFAAGFAIGGPFGAAANLKSGAPADMLKGSGVAEPDSPLGAQSPEEPPRLPYTPAEGLPAPEVPLSLPGPVQLLTPAGPSVFNVNPEGVAVQNKLLRQLGNIPPSQEPGSQGVLNVFDGLISEQELNARMQPVSAPTPEVQDIQPEPVVDPRQGALQFSGPPPVDEGVQNTQMSDQLRVIQERIRRQREYDAAQAELAARQQAEVEQLQRESRGARDLFIMRQNAQPKILPTAREVQTPAMPAQLPLFNRTEAPPVSRGEMLKRGGMAGALPEIPQQVTEQAPDAAQMSLFDEQGNPTIVEPTVTAPIQPMSPQEEWEDKKPEGALSYKDLPVGVRRAWEQDVASNRATMLRAEELADSVELSPAQAVNQSVADAKEAMTPREFRDSISSVIEYAYVMPEDTNNKAAIEAARKAMEDIVASDRYQQEVDNSLIDSINMLPSVEAVYTRGFEKGQYKPWFKRAINRGFLPRITTVIRGLSLDDATKLLESGLVRTGNLPVDTIKKYRAKNPVSGQGGTGTQNTIDNDAKRLADYIHELNTKTSEFNNKQKAQAINKLTLMYDKVRSAGGESFIDRAGNPLSAYFDELGDPYIGIVKNRVRVGTEEFSQEDIKQFEKDLRDAEYYMDLDEPPLSLDDWNVRGYGDDDYGDGRYFRDDGTPITQALPIGRTKLLTSSFVSKLSVKPKVHVYANQADLQAKNAQLYKRAAAARVNGDFDKVNAVGYSFGDGEVIVFSDRILTEKALNYVLAHETLGHFGFRSLLTPAQLNAALDGVYDSSPKVQAAVKTSMAARGMSKHEAIEEYLADFAGALDTNIIAKFWNAVKNFLNKLGVTFEDDMARYFVSQSRRYVRNGTVSGTFLDFAEMAKRAASVESGDDIANTGRFATMSDVYSDQNIVASSAAYARRSFDMQDIGNWFQQAKDAGVRIGDVWERIKGELKTMNFASRENRGYRRLYEILRDTNKDAARLRAKYNAMMDTVLSPAFEVLNGKYSKGATRAQIDTTSRMLREANAAKFASLSEEDIKSFGKLVVLVDNQPTVDPEVLKQLKAKGRFTLDDFKNGFEWQESVMEPVNGVSTEVKKTMRFEGIPTLTEQSPEWVMYNEVRETMDESAIDMLLANYTAGREARTNVERKAEQLLKRNLSENDKAFLDRITNKYMDMYNEGSTMSVSGATTFSKDSVQRASEFLRDFNTALLGKDTDRNAAMQSYFADAEYDDIYAGIEGLKAGSTMQRNDPKLKYAVQQAIANVVLTEESRGGAESFAKRTIAGGYVPYGREGNWQVRIQAVDPKTGQVYKVSEEYRSKLFFAQVDNKADALNMSKEVQGIFDSASDGLYEMEVLDGAEYVVKKVKFVAQAETAREESANTTNANLNEVIGVITRFNVSITPEERAKLVVGLTQQNASARRRLQRSNTPGVDPNTIKYVSKHLEATASAVARKRHRAEVDRLFDESDAESKQLWYGSEAEYKRRKAEWERAKKDPTMPEAAKRAARVEFDDYHFTYVTNSSETMGNRYLDRGRRLIAFMDSQSNVDYTDFASGEAASAVRTATTFAFMGASLATAILNYVGIATNALPAFSAYSHKTGFGGGFGWGQSAIELAKALGNTKNNNQSDVGYWDKLLKDSAALKASGFSRVEAEFMRKEVAGGTMQAALTNSLLGSARGKFKSGATKRFGEAWMSMFNYTEQHSRRAAGLAAFRMAYARAIAEGKDADTAFEDADKLAVNMLDDTLGEYAMFNRPAMFRGGIQQFIFMFKMFPINSIQMLNALPRKDMLLALGVLGMFSGLKGMPFAEDLMDIIDTIAQALGLGPSKVWKGSVEVTLAQALNDFAPGLTPVMMRGILNTFTPANVADRVSLSNIIPGTGIGLAGADVGRELIEIAGPIASFMQGAIAMGGDSIKYALETVGLKEDVTSLNKIARESPVAFLRILGDMYAYDNAGAIVSQKGYVVSEDLHMGTLFARSLGFYPSSATAQNDIVRLSKRIGDYQKEVSGIYRGMYVKAKVNGDDAQAQEVVRMVREWNDAAKGSGLEIPNFQMNANRAYREALKPASERYLKSTSKSIRPVTEQIADIYGLND